MSLLTRITHEAAKRLLDPRQYVTSMPCTPNEDQPVVYLTFDDGPHPDRTHRILDQLAEHNCQATFFMIGQRAQRHPETVRRVLSEGHSIGSHTWSHTSVRGRSAHDYVEDVHRGRIELEQITGRRIELFRPPYGELTPLTLSQLMLHGFRLIHWNFDPRDFERDAASDLVKQFDHRPLENGDVVLLHDDRSVTSEAMHGVLDQWASRTSFRAIPMRPGSITAAPGAVTPPNESLASACHAEPSAAGRSR